MATQQALVLDAKFGTLSLQLRPIPTLKSGHLLVKIHAAALNPCDWMIKDLGILLDKYPAVLGSDIAGIVDQVGDDVKGWEVGDRILFQGSVFDYDTVGFQQYAAIEAGLAAKIPGHLSFSAAATVPLGITTAVFGLWADTPVGLGLPKSFDGQPRSEGPALLIGGATTVGQFAIQVLRISGFNPIIAYASEKHSSYLKSLGATHVVDRNATPIDSLEEAVRSITTSPIHVAYDAVSTKETQNVAYKILAPKGRLVIVLNDYVTEKVDDKTVHFVSGSPYGSPAHREPALELYKHLEKLLATKVIVPTAFEELSGGLCAVPDGLERLKGNQVSGKKLIVLPQDTT